VASDYTIRYQGRMYQIARDQVRPGLRGGLVRLEARLDGSLQARFHEKYLTIQECQTQPKASQSTTSRPARRQQSQKPAALARQTHAGIAKGRTAGLEGGTDRSLPEPLSSPAALFHQECRPKTARRILAFFKPKASSRKSH
jgi:hypothetical protein